MANVYVRSLAGGAATGADWANAYLTLSAALTAKAAGDDFWVSEDHAESTAGAVTLTLPGTAASPNRIICVNHAGTVPPVSADLATTATVITTGANSISFASGFGYIYGITFTAGNGSSAANIQAPSSAASSLYFKSCLIKLGSTGAANQILFGVNTANIGEMVTLDNTPLQFGAVTQSVLVQVARLIWKNTASAIAGSAPTTLFTAGTRPATIICDGVDLSAITGTIVGATSQPSAQFYLKDCKLNAAATVAATPASQATNHVYLTRSDSAGTNYRHEKYTYEGTQTVETTIIRTGGASDGTTGLAWKIVTTANSKVTFPFESLPLAKWNNSTASNVTITVYGIWGGGAVPNNDDIWMEIAYLGSSATPVATFNSANTKADVLAAGTAQTADASTWGGSTTAFKMVVTLSSPQPALKGTIYVTIKAAKATSTFYIDPVINLS